MARMIGEVQPRYCFVENSPMLTSRGLGTVLGDLAEMGFDAEWGVLSAADVGANHKRERIWIVGYSNNNGQIATKIRKGFIKGSNNNKAKQKQASQFERPGKQYAELAYPSFQSISNKPNSRGNIGLDEQQGKGTGNIDGSSSKGDVSNASSIRQQGQRKYEQSIDSTQNCQRQTDYAKSIGRPEFWSVEPPLGRVANGVAYRLDRLKAIGNGQVPLCAATAWKLLKERLDGHKQRGVA